MTYFPDPKQIINNVLPNLVHSAIKSPTALEASGVIPLEVTQYFWELIDTIVNNYNHPTIKGREQRETKLTALIIQTLQLLNTALAGVGIGEQDLEKKLAGVEEHLKGAVKESHFDETVNLLTYLMKFGRILLNEYGPYPGYALDANMLRRTIDRLNANVINIPEEDELTDLATVRTYMHNTDFMFLLRSILGKPDGWWESPFSELYLLKNLTGQKQTSATGQQPTSGYIREEADVYTYLKWVWLGAYDTDINDLIDWQEDAWRTEDKKLEYVSDHITQESSFLKEVREIREVRKIKDKQDFSQEILDDAEEKEIWFYINGVVTDPWIARLNAAHLFDTFHRPINILHNPTEGLYRDLRECVIGRVKKQRGFDIVDALKKKLLGTLSNGKGKTKIVVIAHSQGTIITADLVKRLRDDTSPVVREMVSRMEIFNFALCTDEFPQDCCRCVEHYINEFDLVSSLSIVPANPPEDNPYRIPGRIFQRRGAWGHLLGAHYLEGFKNAKYRNSEFDHESVLFSYLDGKYYGSVIVPLDRRG
jgi:hypothetical protein